MQTVLSQPISCSFNPCLFDVSGTGGWASRKATLLPEVGRYCARAANKQRRRGSDVREFRIPGTCWPPPALFTFPAWFRNIGHCHDTCCVLCQMCLWCSRTVLVFMLLGPTVSFARKAMSQSWHTEVVSQTVALTVGPEKSSAKLQNLSAPKLHWTLYDAE